MIYSDLALSNRFPSVELPITAGAIAGFRSLSVGTPSFSILEVSAANRFADDSPGVRS